MSRHVPRLFVLLCTLAVVAACHRPPAAETKPGRTDDRARFIAYVPSGARSGSPLLLALSPGGDAKSMIRAWQPIADRRGWIIAASKEFRNGIDYEVVFAQLNAELDELLRDYPIDPKRVAMMGLSGGAMASHAFSQEAPNRVRAVIANCGMMEEAFMRADYPRGGIIAFVASPTDFRFGAMKRDRAFLDGKGWTSTWIEFSGGHTLAPSSTFEQAADWLDKQW